MLKKIIGCLVLAVLGAGSICGVIYGCKYHDLNKNYQTTEQDKSLSFGKNIVAQS